MRNYLFILTLLVPLALHSQEVITFSSDQGLSNTCIRCIYEDSNQNVWIATNNGLNRWDGVKMNVYRHEDKATTPLLHNSVTSILEYDKNHILIGSGMGLQMYDYTTDSFSDVPIINANGDTIPARIPQLCKLSNGSIDVCTSGFGNFCIEGEDIAAKQTDAYTPEGHLISQIVEDAHQRIWVLTERDGIYTKDKGQFHQIEGTEGVIAIVEGNKGIYAAKTNGDFIKIHNLKTEIIPTNSFISNISSNKKGQVFICTDGNGLLVYDESEDEILHNMTQTTDFNLASSNVKDAMLDHEGNLWIGVYWKGVIVQPAAASSFNYIGRRSAIRNTIGTNCTTAISNSQNGWIWVATDHQGLYKISPDGTQSIHYEPSDISGVPSTITAIHEDEFGTLWLGSSIGKLSKVDNVTNTQSLKCVDSKLGVERIYSIAEDSNQTLWIATMGFGIYSYNLVTKELNHYSGLLNGEEQYPFSLISNIWVNTLAVDENMLYVGTSDGMEIFSIEDGKLKKLGRYFTKCAVNTIKFAGSTIWVGTSIGLIRAEISYDGKLHDSKYYDQASGISNNMVNAIELAYSANSETYNVWLSTDNGLCCFNPTNETFTNYYKSDGLQGNEFSRGVSIASDANLYFGGINGLTYFNATEIGSTFISGNPTLRIIDIFIQGKAARAYDKSGSYTMFTDWISETDRIDLCHEDNSFVIELSTMSLAYHHLQYQFRINEDEWTNAPEDQSRISFNNLSPGTYHISFRLLDERNNENIETANSNLTITIVIHPAWYASWWAWLIYILIAISLILYFWKQYKERITSKKLLETHRQSQMLSEMRTKFFMDISHEIRTPMTLILGPLQKLMGIVRNEDSGIDLKTIPVFEKNLALIQQNADRIMTLINQLMDVRKIEKGQFPLHYNRIELVGFLQNLYNLFSANAKDRNITFEFNHDDPHLFACVDPQNLDKIVMNLLSNAFKFTPKDGHITLSLSSSILINHDSEEPSIIISVTDNGIGIPDEQKKHVFDRFFSSSSGTGIGLNLSYMLAHLHEGELSVSDNPEGQGTRFVLEIPQALYLYEGPATKATEEVGEEIKGTELVIAEDDESIREYICDELSRTFIIIHQFGNGQEAWNYLIANAPKVSLVVSDIMMPIMDGTTLCRKIKQNFNTNHIPVILLTAKVSDQEQIEGLTAGADEYVTKPFSIDVLTSRISNLLRSRSLLQSKYQNLAQEKSKIDQVELTSPDEQLMQRVMKVINANLANPDLSIEMIADQVGVSRVHFHRRLKNITNLTPRDFLKGIRLRQAAKLLQEKHFDITAVSEATGFKSVSSFSTTFKQAYGVSPTEFRSQEHQP